MEKEDVKKSTCSMLRRQPSEAVMDLSAFMIYKLSQYVQERFEEFFAEMPVKARHFCVLRVLFVDGPMAQQQLCDALWIDRATMVGVIQLLIDNDLVKKKEHPEDKRSHLILLTAKGEKFYERHSEEFNKLDRNIFSGLQESEIKQFKALLRKSMAYLGNE
jgi:DNA-binding MarR family transcriptional regulator